MAVKYGEFTFPKSPARPTMRSRGGPSTPMAYVSGGSVSTPFRYKDGGGISKYSGHTKSMPNIAKAGAGANNLKTKTSKDPGPTKADKGNRQDAVRAPAFAAGGHAKGCSCKMCSGGPAMKKAGGAMKVADGKVPMGEKTSWNKDDATSPGSPKRTPPGQGVKNKAAASNKFATDGENTEPATKQTGNVERMSGWSDFKKGGKVHKKAMGGKITTPYAYAKGGSAGDRFEMSDGAGNTRRTSDGTTANQKGTMAYKDGGRIKNLGHYAHGGKVRPGEKAVNANKFEAAAGTPKKAPGTRVERPSGMAKMAEGGLSRGTSPKRNAAIHAKQHKPSMGAHKGPGGGALAGLANALSGAGMPSQGGGMSPPGMAPSMGSPPGGQMGAIAPQAPTMGGGPPGMAKGGSMMVKHVIVHHVSHGRR